MTTQLKKILTLRTVISSSAGMAMATSCYLAGMQVAIIVAGELAWISILVAGALCILSAMCFSELTSMYPSAAGIKLFMENAFSEKIAIAIGMFYVLLGISMVGAESYLLSSVMLEAAGNIINPTADRFFWQFIFILFVGAINFQGVRITGIWQDILTYSMLGFLIAVSLATFFMVDVHVAAAWQRPDFTLDRILLAAAVGIFMYVGYEWVTPLAEETTDYRMIGKGMMIAIGLLSVTYALFVVAMYAGLTEAQRQSGTSIPHILFARNLFGNTGAALFILMSILASVTSFNSGLLNTSRFTYAMARDHTLPGFLARLHPVRATPWAAILALVGFAVVLSAAILITGQYLFIIVMAAMLECFIYVVMAICVIRLRRKFPDRERAYRIPFGHLIPIATIVIFSGLLLGMIADSTRNYMGDIVFHNYWVAAAMAGFGALCAAYTLLVVPRLRKAAEQRASTRKRRRPRRPTA